MMPGTLRVLQANELLLGLLKVLSKSAVEPAFPSHRHVLPPEPLASF